MPPPVLAGRDVQVSESIDALAAGPRHRTVRLDRARQLSHQLIVRYGFTIDF